MYRLLEAALWKHRRPWGSPPAIPDIAEPCRRGSAFFSKWRTVGADVLFVETSALSCFKLLGSLMEINADFDNTAIIIADELDKVALWSGRIKDSGGRNTGFIALQQ